MNGQRIDPNGYYLHYKNKVYRFLGFASEDNFSKSPLAYQDDYSIYQPQYNTPEYSDSLLTWARPMEMFFENIETGAPRFKYIGRTKEDVMNYLKENNIDVVPDFKKEGILHKPLKNLVFENLSIYGFSIHSETLEPQILYMKNELNKLLIMPKSEFKSKLGIDPDASPVADYLNELLKE